jgi:hypothetical protein
MDPYITFQVDSAVVPLQECIDELGDQHDNLASQLADLQNHYNTVEHILVLDGPSPPMYMSQSLQTTNQDVSGMGKVDIHTMIWMEKRKVKGKHRKDAMETWHKSLNKYLLQTHINFPRFLPIFPDSLERLSHLTPIY